MPESRDPAFVRICNAADTHFNATFFILTS
jgi:hypothetical protein